MGDFELKTQQMTLFNRYVKYFIKIHAEGEKKPLNATLLAKRLRKHKQQVTPVLRKLEESKLIRLEEVGKNKFIHLMDDGIRLYSEYFKDVPPNEKLEEIKTPLDDNCRKKFKGAFALFIDATHDGAKNYALNEIESAVNQLPRNISIDWCKEKHSQTFFNNFLEKPDKYTINIRTRLFYTLCRLYEWDYFDERNFDYFDTYCEEEITGQNFEIFRCMIQMSIRALSNRSIVSKKPYLLFLKLTEKMRFVENATAFIDYEENRFRKLPDKIKEQLRKYLFDLVNNKPKDADKQDKLIDRLREVLG